MSDPVIDSLDAVWRSIIDLGNGLSEAEWKLPTDLPGWSVQDNVSHIIGTERNMRGEPTPEVTPRQSDHVHTPIGEMKSSDEITPESLATTRSGTFSTARARTSARQVAS